MWIKVNADALLEGIQINAAILKSSMELAQKIKNGTAL